MNKTAASRTSGPAPIREAQSLREPHDPTVTMRASLLLDSLDELEANIAATRSTIFTEVNEAPKELKPGRPQSLDQMLAVAGTRLACLVGETATINSKLS